MSDPANPDDRGPAGLRSLSLIVAIVALIGVLPSFLLVFVTLFLFDAPGAGDNPLTVALALGCWAAPVTCLFAAWNGFSGFRRFTPAKLWIAIGLPVGLCLYLTILYGLLDAQCGGKFAC